MTPDEVKGIDNAVSMASDKVKVTDNAVLMVPNNVKGMAKRCQWRLTRSRARTMRC